MLKKLMLSICCFSLLCCIMYKTVYANEKINVNNDQYQIDYSQNGDMNKTIVKNVKGEMSIAVFNRTTGVLTVDGEEVNYSVYQPTDIKIEKQKIIMRAAASDWTPVLVAKGLNFNMSTLFKSSAQVISTILSLMGYLQLYFGQDVVTYIINDVLSKAALKVGSKINVIYSYDWYRTNKPVLLPGATIKTICSRYQNYRATLKYGSRTFSKVAQKKGKWWSGQKPY